LLLFADKFVFGLKTAVTADVGDFESTLPHDTSHQKAAMTVGGILFATEQRNTELAGAILQALDAGEKPR
jgi:hypothetical protein